MLDRLEASVELLQMLLRSVQLVRSMQLVLFISRLQFSWLYMH